MKKFLLSITAVVALGTTSFAQVDTLSEFFTGNPTMYVVDAVAPLDSGFIFGNNAFNDKAKLMKYDAATGLNGGGFVKGALLAIKAKTDIANASIKVKMWQTSTTTALGTELGSVTIPLTAIDTANSAFALAGGGTRIYNVSAIFTNPIAIPAGGSFMLGVELPANTAGMVGIVNNVVGSFTAAATNVYEVWEDNTLHTMPSSWGAGLTSAMAIYPIVNYTSSVDETNLTASVYPNPANNVVNFTLNGVELSTVAVYGLDGKMVISTDVNATSGQIDVASLTPGMYIYEITSVSGNVVKNTFVKK